MDCVEKAPGSRRSAQPARVNLALKADFREVNSFSTIASNESSIPDHVRQFIAKTYSIDPNSTMFTCSDKPQRQAKDLFSIISGLFANPFNEIMFNSII